MKAMVNETGLNHPALIDDVTIRDVAGEVGFDCDDVADITQRYLQQRLPDANVAIITAQYTYATEPRPGGGVNAGHAMVIVEYQQQYWLLNPLRDHVSEAMDSLEMIQRYAESHIRSAYMPDPNLPVRVSDLYRNHMELGAGTPWYEDGHMRRNYDDFLRRQQLPNRGGLFPPQYDPDYSGYEPPNPIWEYLWRFGGPKY